MNCGEVLRHLGPYLDSECDREVTLAIAEHLERCGPCAERLAREKDLEDRLAGHLGACEPGDDLLWRRLEGAVTRSGRRRLLWRGAAAAVVLAFAVGGASLLLRSGASDLVRAACADHAKLSREKFSEPEEPLSWEAVSASLAGRIPFAVSIKGPSPEGITPVGARPCAFGDEPVAFLRCCLGGEPVSVAILPEAALGSFPEAAGEFARKGDAFSCGRGDLHVGLARRGGTLVCVTGLPSGEALREAARILAERVEVSR